MDVFDENDVIPAQADCSVPPFAENLDEKRPVVGTFCSFGFEGDPLSAVSEKHCQSGGTELEGHEHTVQLLETGGDGTQLSALLETDDTTTESSVNKGSFWCCQQWPTCNGTRRPWKKGKDETSPA